MNGFSHPNDQANNMPLGLTDCDHEAIRSQYVRTEGRGGERKTEASCETYDEQGRCVDWVSHVNEFFLETSWCADFVEHVWRPCQLDVTRTGSVSSEHINEPPICAITATPGSISLDGEGLPVGYVEISTSDQNCGWEPLSSADWLTVRAVGQQDGLGAGSVLFEVSRNTTGAARSAVISLADQLIEVTQSEALGQTACRDRGVAVSASARRS